MLLTEEQIHTCFNNLRAKIQSEIQQMNYGDTLDRYELLMLQTVPLKKPSFTRCYEHTIQFFDVPFTFYWDFRKFNSIIIQNKIESREFDTEPLYKTVDLKSINMSHLKNVSSEPIVVGFIPFAKSQLVVLDGNHRVVSSYRSNITTIRGYLLSQKHHLQAMPEQQQMVFKILNNIMFNMLHFYDKIPYAVIKTQLFDI